jgi:Cu+-exporting ATPase
VVIYLSKQTQTESQADKALQAEKYIVSGMTCAACQANIQKAVCKLDGVEGAEVNLLTNEMSVRFDPNAVDSDRIISAVERIGYGADVDAKGQKQTSTSGAAVQADRSVSGASQSDASPPVQNRASRAAWETARQLKRQLIVGLLWLLPLMYITMGGMIGLPLPAFLSGLENAVNYAFTQLLLTLPVLFVNRSYFRSGFKGLTHLLPNMDSLIAVGSSAAVVYGIFAIYRMAYGTGHGDMGLVEHYYHQLYFESAAMILVIITIGKYLEARSKGHTSDAITKLIELAPAEAEVLLDGEVTVVPVQQIVPGDLVQIRPGASIPVDGLIESGHASLDESALTGESLPAERGVGEKVTAGTVSRGGYFTFRATNVGDDTDLAKIIRLVEEAAASKAPISRLVDRIAAIFVPVVMAIALVVLIIWLVTGNGLETALNMSISVLVISCPCALGLATPLAIMAGTGQGSRHNVLIKSGEALETMHNIQTVVLDKTGTITAGRPVVTDVLPSESHTSEELLILASGIEQHSEHILAEAIMAYAATQNIARPECDNFQNIPGRGVEAVVNGRTGRGGNFVFAADILGGSAAEQLLSEQNIALADQGKTPLYFFEDDRYVGAIALADPIKKGSAEAIRALRENGLKVVMLTGDNQRTARAIQQKLGLEDVISDVLPDEKAAVVQSLQEDGALVAMVGDGINDAPALERADVGVAIGSGTDVAIESADIVLMKNDLRDVVTAISLSKATMRNIRQNLFWAFIYNVLGIPIAAGLLQPAFGISLNPMLGATAMALSSLFVVGNALRLTRWKPAPLPAAEPERVNDPSSQPQIVQNLQESPQQSSQKSPQGGTSMNKQYLLQINGMSCGHCSAAVTKALKAVPGVLDAEVNLEEKNATVSAGEDVLAEDLDKAVVEAGYEVVGVNEK